MIPIYDNDFDRKFDEAVDEIDRKQREVKPMRLIDADKLKAHYAWWKGGGREMTMDEAKNDFDTIIDLQPTVKAEPIKHGRWTGINKNKYNDDEATCSICGVTFASDYSNPSWWDYCPNCGAKMDEVEE